MLIGIEGEDLGSGKTIYAVRCCIKDYLNGQKIISNTPLFNIEYEDFDIDKFLSNEAEYRKSLSQATILLDEITVYMDCRLSSSKQNLLMGYLVLQSRKRGLNIYYTTQNLDLVDFKRLVKYTNIIVYAQKIYVKNPDNKLEDLDDYRHYTIVDMRKRRHNITKLDIPIKRYFKYYDTDYIVEPLVKSNKPKVKLEVKNAL